MIMQYVLTMINKEDDFRIDVERVKYYAKQEEQKD